MALEEQQPRGYAQASEWYAHIFSHSTSTQNTTALSTSTCNKKPGLHVEICPGIRMVGPRSKTPFRTAYHTVYTLYSTVTTFWVFGLFLERICEDEEPIDGHGVPPFLFFFFPFLFFFFLLFFFLFSFFFSKLVQITSTVEMKRPLMATAKTNNYLPNALCHMEAEEASQKSQVTRHTSQVMRLLYVLYSTI